MKRVGYLRSVSPLEQMYARAARSAPWEVADGTGVSRRSTAGCRPRPRWPGCWTSPPPDRTGEESYDRDQFVYSCRCHRQPTVAVISLLQRRRCVKALTKPAGEQASQDLSPAPAGRGRPPLHERAAQDQARKQTRTGMGSPDLSRRIRGWLRKV